MTVFYKMKKRKKKERHPRLDDAQTQIITAL